MQHKNLRSIPTVELRNELAARTIERDPEAVRAPKALIDLAGAMGARLSTAPRFQLADLMRDAADRLEHALPVKVV
jgi:hypothetical protein